MTNRANRSRFAAPKYTKPIRTSLTLTDRFGQHTLSAFPNASIALPLWIYSRRL
ncbi:MAG: hypothetical protein ABF824_11395 [Acetobacter sp.]